MLNIPKHEAKCPNLENPPEMDVFSFFGQLSELIQTEFPFGIFSFSVCLFCRMKPFSAVEQVGEVTHLLLEFNPSMFVTAGRSETSTSPSHPEKEKGDS